MKLFTALLVAAMLLSACQPTGEPPGIPDGRTPTVQPPDGATAVPSVSATAPPPTETPVYLVPLEQMNGLQLNFAHPWTGDTAEVVDQMVDAFNQSNEWGIHIKVQRSGSSMALVNRIEKGSVEADFPQIVAAPSEYLLSWLEKGDRLRPLNDLIADPYFGLSEQQRADFPLVFWQQDQSAGTQAGIPATRDAPVLFYNEGWAKELGFSEPPASLEDFKNQACAAGFANAHDRVAANDGTGGWMINTDGLVVYSWLRSFGITNTLTGQPLQFHFDQPAALNAFTFLRSLADEGCAWFARTTAANEYFANRQALFYAGNLTDLALQVRTNRRLNVQDSWRIIQFPGQDTPVTVASGLSYGVFRSNPAAETAGWLFIRWMNQPEQAAKILLATGGLPVNSAVIDMVQNQMPGGAQWQLVLTWMPTIESVPSTAGWRTARFVLQDGFWQALQSYVQPEQLPEILQEMDATILEVEAQSGP
jgi:ABC-type glycerol-3-phosphate transport system substrate-binding protein